MKFLFRNSDHRIRLGVLIVMAMALFPIPGLNAATIPADIEIADTYEPGYGPAVGIAQRIQGKVVVVHANQKTGYLVQKNTPLFKSDTFYTASTGRAVFVFNDGSALNLLPDTVITISRSVYSPEKKTRSTFLNMAVGKARFWVTKLKKYKDRSFKVRSRTAVMGVRGSDFIVKATAKMTEVVTLEDTLLALRSMVNMGGDPTLLSTYQRSLIPEDGEVGTPADISPEEAQALKDEFSFGDSGEDWLAEDEFNRASGEIGADGYGYHARVETPTVVPPNAIVSPNDITEAVPDAPETDASPEDTEPAETMTDPREEIVSGPALVPVEDPPVPVISELPALPGTPGNL